MDILVSTHICKAPLPDTIEAFNEMLATVIVITLALISPEYL